MTTEKSGLIQLADAMIQANEMQEKYPDWRMVATIDHLTKPELLLIAKMHNQQAETYVSKNKAHHYVYIHVGKAMIECRTDEFELTI